MVVGLSPLVVLKEYGSVSVTILDVSLQGLHFERCAYTSVLALRRVLHLRQVTQCAMLEEFGIFLVLADKVSVSSPDPAPVLILF